jgi:hypothetical protein
MPSANSPARKLARDDRNFTAELYYSAARVSKFFGTALYGKRAPFRDQGSVT